MALKGFVVYSLVRSSDGGFSAAVFQDEAGTDESVRVARERIATNAGGSAATAPTISEGAVISPNEVS
ncbi:MAG: hypothetical protein WBF58_15740 [Xanthobacteraceae bacterium]